MYTFVGPISFVTIVFLCKKDSLLELLYIMNVQWDDKQVI